MTTLATLPAARHESIPFPFRHPGTARIRSAGAMARLVETVGATLEEYGYSRQDRHAVRLSLEEAVVNGLKHGNGGDPSKEVRVRWAASASSFKAVVEDQGPGFDPDAVPDPLADENLERPCGRGLFLMRAYMTWVRYNRRGNAVSLFKQRSAA
jgi:serine/threonine-protein kinase RsbW